MDLGAARVPRGPSGKASRHFVAVGPQMGLAIVTLRRAGSQNVTITRLAGRRLLRNGSSSPRISARQQRRSTAARSQPPSEARPWSRAGPRPPAAPPSAVRLWPAPPRWVPSSRRVPRCRGGWHHSWTVTYLPAATGHAPPPEATTSWLAIRARKPGTSRPTTTGPSWCVSPRARPGSTPPWCGPPSP